MIRTVFVRRTDGASVAIDYTDLNGVDWEFNLEQGSGIDRFARVHKDSTKTYKGLDDTELPSLAILGRLGLIREVDSFAEKNKKLATIKVTRTDLPLDTPSPSATKGLPFLAWLAIAYVGFRVLKKATGGRYYRG